MTAPAKRASHARYQKKAPRLLTRAQFPSHTTPSLVIRNREPVTMIIKNDPPPSGKLDGVKTVAQSANNTINYDAAVREGKRIVAKMEREWWQLCELADGIETQYGDGTLERFAKDIGVVPCTFLRRMSVYQAWRSAP